MKHTGSSIWIRGIIALSMVLILTFGVVTTANAAGSDDDGTIGPDEVINDDVFLNGNEVVMDGTVNGVLFAAGQTITINGTVNGDAILMGSEIIISDNAVIDGNLFSGAQSIQVEGEVTGSVAAGSSSITFTGAEIGRNVYFGGFSLELDETSSVAIDLFSGAYQAILQGSVGRDANIGAGAVEIDGAVGRNVTIDLGEADSNMSQDEFFMPFVPMGVATVIEPGLRMSENASIGGELNYTYSVNQSDTIAAQPEGGIVFQTPVPDESTHPGAKAQPEVNAWNLIFGRFMTIPAKFWRDLSSLLILGGLVVWLAPSLLKKSIEPIRNQPLPSGGYGLLVSMGGYIAAALAAFVILIAGLFLNLFTLGALQQVTFGFGFTLLSLAFIAFTLLIFFGSRLVVTYFIGEWIVRKIAPASPASQQPFWGLAVGVLIFAVLHAMPFAGWFIGLITTIFGMGAIWLLFVEWRKKRSPQPELAEVSETP